MNLYFVETVHHGEHMGTGSFRLELEHASVEVVLDFVNRHLREQHAANYEDFLKIPEFPTDAYIEEYRRYLEDSYDTPSEIEGMVQNYASTRIREPTFSEFKDLTWKEVYLKFHVSSLGWVHTVGCAPVADKHAIFYKWYTENICFVIL